MDLRLDCPVNSTLGVHHELPYEHGKTIRLLLQYLRPGKDETQGEHEAVP
jgi:hypothetical protein